MSIAAKLIPGTDWAWAAFWRYTSKSNSSEMIYYQYYHIKKGDLIVSSHWSMEYRMLKEKQA